MVEPLPHLIYTEPKTQDTKHSAGKSSFIWGQCTGQVSGRGRHRPSVKLGACRGPTEMMDEIGGG